MKYSLKWLNELISIEEFIENPSELSNLLSLKGLEVEQVHEQKWDKIVIGQITRQSRHPDADKLKLCEVKIKTDQPPLSIICGADNQKPGNMAAVCLDGAKLPGGLVIKERKIRGEFSQGMLASEEELGLKDSSKGILILPASAPIGERLDHYLGLRDCFFDITTPPNRPDLLSHIGLARELSGLLNKPLKLNHLFWPTSYKKEVFNLGISKNLLQIQKKNLPPRPKFEKVKTSFKAEVKEPEICPLYLGVMMKGVKISPSPLWLKQRLNFLGLKSINNVVDITQLILLEWGQPLHAFDHDLIEGSLSVRKAHSKESMTALDDSELEFCGDELIISDEKKPLALAGVIGGKSSAISDSTKNIFIESAVFVPYAVRRAARRFKLNTDSAFFFSRGAADPSAVLSALKRACSLIQQTAGGLIHPNIYRCQGSSPPPEKKAVEIDEASLSERLGYPVLGKEFSRLMERMNCTVKRKRFSKFIITPPPYRKDLNIKEDFIEEWARLKGYEFVKEALPSITPQIKKGGGHFQLDKIKDLARAQGFYQAVNYSFTDSSFEEEFLGSVSTEGKALSPVISIKNPISQDLNSLRRSLLPGLFQNLVLNIRRGRLWGRVFEQGVLFSKSANSKVFNENESLGFVLWGQRKTLWQDESERSVFFDIKAFVESLLKRSGLAFFTLAPLNFKTPFFHPKKSLLVKAGGGGEVLGSFGVLHPVMAEKNKIRTETALGEINLSLLFSQPQKKQRFKPLSSKPSAVRDISLVMSRDCPAGEVLLSMKKLAPPFCQSIDVLDCYEDSELKKSRQKSVTFRWVLQGDEKTLSEGQIAKETQSVLGSLAKKWPLKARAGE